jgi:hypothetical protein
LRADLIQALGSMSDIYDRPMLLFSLQRALLGEVHPQLRQASIEADPVANLVRVRFEYDGEPSEVVRESGSCTATEVIADFPAPWQIAEEYLSVPAPSALSPLANVAYLRAEQQHAT